MREYRVGPHDLTMRVRATGTSTIRPSLYTSLRCRGLCGLPEVDEVGVDNRHTDTGMGNVPRTEDCLEVRREQGDVIINV